MPAVSYIFVGSEDEHGAELWKSDGTEGGTVLVKDIEPGNGGISISNYGVLNDKVYFFCKYPRKWLWVLENRWN
jgi:ELWxxDGT repeat protein